MNWGIPGGENVFPYGPPQALPRAIVPAASGDEDESGCPSDARSEEEESEDSNKSGDEEEVPA